MWFLAIVMWAVGVIGICVMRRIAPEYLKVYIPYVLFICVSFSLVVAARLTGRLF